MQIDITKLLTNSVSSIKLDSSFIIPKDYLNNSRIDDLKKLKIVGTLKIDEENELIINGNITGIMTLKDDLTLKPVDYNFNVEFEDSILEKQNILDITDILWQNIVIEIPSKVRSTDEDKYPSGDGWRVISEEELEKERNASNNPFSNLEELLKTKEDK